MKLSEFLNKYFYKHYLERILNNMDLKVGGIKDELIKRILDAGFVDIELLLLYLYKNDLKWICEDNDLRVSGTREDLINRIVENIKIEKPEKKKKKAKVKESEILKQQLKNERKGKRKLQLYLLSAFIIIAILVDIFIYNSQLIEIEILATIITVEAGIFLFALGLMYRPKASQLQQ